ncbi:MAG TPA: CDP-diacylglycerol--serine O-phosphatidyltransferase [Candidatus Brocadiia bacterium]|nr:CDP-diacylglycerol--serine O-phosphatidyltransferase [Candidatus Brocadiia bacterium]
MKRIPILPTLVTLGNAFCGFAAISFTMDAHASPASFAENMKFAGWLIMLAIIFDALDGKVARLAKQTSKFGVELDSLSDVISFGVAPGLIIKTIAHQLQFYSRVAWVTGSLFMLCAALRLARFNVDTGMDEASHRSFHGLPSPAAGGFVASLAVMSYTLRSDSDYGRVAAALEPIMDGLLCCLPFLGAALALLMISNVPYPHLATRLLRSREPFDHLVTIILILLFAMMTRPFSLPLFFGIYVFAGVVNSLKNLVMSRAKVLQPAQPPPNATPGKGSDRDSAQNPSSTCPRLSPMRPSPVAVLRNHTRRVTTRSPRRASVIRNSCVPSGRSCSGTRATILFDGGPSTRACASECPAPGAFSVATTDMSCRSSGPNGHSATASSAPSRRSSDTIRSPSSAVKPRRANRV